ncbi:MAG: thioredoxin fold domain-containing protein [bacterium]|nr:thioredoxin fold domain-containing protein [bacterium]
MNPPTMDCPKCGRTVPEASECVACGVVFAKIRTREEPSTPHQSEPARGFRLEPILGVVILLALGTLAALQWVEGRVDDLEAPPEPVPSLRPEIPRDSAADRSSERVSRQRPSAPVPAPVAALPVPEPAPKPVVEPPKPRWVDPDSSWFQGAAGFNRGLERARTKNQAVLVYFYADWCGYCRQLESELLSRAVVQEYTKYLVKIKVNPEKGAAERALANRYGVTGYPSVFVHPAGLGGAKKIRGMTKKSGEWRVLSPRGYVDNLAAAAGERFGPS